MNNSPRSSASWRVSVRLGCVFCFTLFALLASANAQLIYADSFDYPDGEITEAPGSPWTTNYPPADGVSLISGRLFLTASNQESIRMNFPTSFNNGFIYSRMIVNFSVLPTNAGNYFAFYRGNFADNLRGRIWASTNGAAPGTFRLGITTISSPPAMIAQDLQLGTDYTVVTRYQVTNSHCTLWINPRDESDTTARADDLDDQGLWTIGQFGFLQTAYYEAGQGNYVGALTVDDLHIGRTFAEVLPLVKFTSISNAPDGTIAMRAIGQATTNYIFQANTDLLTTNWLTLGTNSAGTNGIFNLLDPDAANFSRRFYRLRKE